MKHALALLALVVAPGCAHFHRAAALPQPDEWTTMLALARQDADSGRYESADSAIAGFIAAHAGTKQATEALFWRALYKTDPANRSGSLGAGVAGLDAYLGADSATWYRPEAVVLRRTAAIAQALKLAASSPADSPAATTAVPDREALKSRDAEIAGLRDQLAKANAELDRIKKRLANPKH